MRGKGRGGERTAVRGIQEGSRGKREKERKRGRKEGWKAVGGGDADRQNKR